MPLEWDDHPGLQGDQLRVARGPHRVTASGLCATIASWIPQFPSQAGQGGTTFIFELTPILWLILAIMRLADDVLPDTLLFQYIVHVTVLGVALELCLDPYGPGALDTTPCNPSVARRRLREAAERVRAVNPLAFDVPMASLYQVIMPAPAPPLPPQPPVAQGQAPIVVGVQPLAYNAHAAAARMRQLVSRDDTLLALADAELELQPRITEQERDMHSGADFFFTVGAQVVAAGTPVNQMNALPAPHVSEMILRLFVSRTLDSYISRYMTTGEARLQLHAMLSGRIVLDCSNVMTAILHTLFFRGAISTEIPESEMLRFASILVAADQGTAVALSLASFTATETSLAYMVPRVQQPEMRSLPQNERIKILLTELASSKSNPARSNNDSNGANTGLPSTALIGYPPAHREALKKKIYGQDFLDMCKRIWDMIMGDAVNPPAHPFECITACLKSRDKIIIDAVTGRCASLTGVPLVAEINRRLVHHGPAWAGDLAIQSIMPPLPNGVRQRDPILLDDLWNKVICKGRYYPYNWEELKPMVEAACAGGTATFDKVPMEQLFCSQTRLASTALWLVPLLEEVGWTSAAGMSGTPLMAFKQASSYYDSSSMIAPAVRVQTVAASLVKIFKERSRLEELALSSSDPTYLFDTLFVPAESTGAITLLNATNRLAHQTDLSRSLNELNGQRGISIHINAIDVTSARSAGADTRALLAARKPSVDGADGAKDDDAMELPPRGDAEAVARAKALSLIGTKSSVVHFHPPGTSDLDCEFMWYGDNPKDMVEMAKFWKAAPKCKCPATWCSSLKQPSMVCQHVGEDRHDGVASKAHYVTVPNFKSAVLPTLLVAFVKPTTGLATLFPEAGATDVVSSVRWAQAPCTLGNVTVEAPWWRSAPQGNASGFSRSEALFSLPDTGGTWLDLDALGAPLTPAPDPFEHSVALPRLSAAAVPFAPSQIGVLAPNVRVGSGTHTGVNALGSTALAPSNTVHSAPHVPTPAELAPSLWVEPKWDRSKLNSPAAQIGVSNVTCDGGASPVLVAGGTRAPIDFMCVEWSCNDGFLDKCDWKGRAPSSESLGPLAASEAVCVETTPTQGARTHSPRGLHICCGLDPEKELGFSRRCGQLGIEVVSDDLLTGNDLLNEEYVNSRCAQIAAGPEDPDGFDFVAGGPPCGFTTVMRHFNTHKGPPVLFTTEHPDGIPYLRGSARLELFKARKIYTNSCRMFLTAVRAQKLVIIEHPEDRSDPHYLGGRLYDKRGKSAKHGSLWGTSWMREVMSVGELQQSACAYCSLPTVVGDVERLYQKYTRWAYSRELSPELLHLGRYLCNHPEGYHPKPSGFDAEGRYRSRHLASWHAYCCLVNAHALASAFARRGLCPAPCAWMPPVNLCLCS